MEVYISDYDIRDWQDTYACGSKPLAPTIKGVPSYVLDGPGVYVCEEGVWKKYL